MALSKRSRGRKGETWGDDGRTEEKEGGKDEGMRGGVVGERE